jgi:hypothetical protein
MRMKKSGLVRIFSFNPLLQLAFKLTDYNIFKDDGYILDDDAVLKAKRQNSVQ